LYLQLILELPRLDLLPNGNYSNVPINAVDTVTVDLLVSASATKDGLELLAILRNVHTNAMVTEFATLPPFNVNALTDGKELTVEDALELDATSLIAVDSLLSLDSEELSRITLELEITSHMRIANG